MSSTVIGGVDNDKMNGVQVIISIIKCVVGTGSFFLPAGIAQAGLWGGVVGLLVMALVTVYLNWIIMSAKHYYKVDTYHELCVRVLGPIAGWMMYVSIIATNLGSCSVYLVTGAQLLSKVSDVLSTQVYILIFAIFELLISWLPSFKYLAWTSIIGILGLVTAMVSVFVYGFSNGGIKPIDSYPALVVNTYAVFFSTAAFLYIQPSTFFPIENATAEPEKFNYYNTIAYCIIAIANTLFATIAYMFFGDNTQSLVLENLCPSGVCKNTYTILAQIALFVDVVFTFPLIMAPAHEVIESSLFREPDESYTSLNQPFSVGPSDVPESHSKCPISIEYSLLYRNAIRTLSILVTYGVAAAIPNISALVGIVSGVTLTFNAFIMGPLVHLRWQYGTLLRDEEGLIDEKVDKWWLLSLFGHTFLILSGFVLGVWSTYLAITQI